MAGNIRIMNNRQYTNNFYGNIDNVQIQQNVKNSNQIQKVNEKDFDYDEVQKIVAILVRYEFDFKNEFGVNAHTMVEKKKILGDLIDKKEEPSKIVSVLKEIYDICKNAAGGILSTGIMQLISQGGYGIG